MTLGRLNHVGVATPSIEQSIATDKVIMPHSTRRRIALGLRKLKDKQLENSWKKHDKIPL